MTRSTLFGIALLLILIDPCTSQTRANVEALSTAVLTNYDKDVRPNDDQSQPTNITFSLEIFGIVQTDEKSGLLSMALAIHNEWQDPRVSWTPASYGGLTDVKMSDSKMWRPVYAFGTPIDELVTFGPDIGKIYYSHQGEADHFTPDLMSVQCDYDVKNFPFDKQTCTFLCIPLGFRAADINFIFPNNPIDLRGFTENGEWELNDISLGLLYATKWTSVSVTVVLHRRWQFFLLIYMAPIIFLLLLNSMVFVLPPDSGERVGYAITCLLSLTVFLSVIADILPSTSKNMSYMSVFLILMLGFSTMYCIATIVSLIVYHKDETKPIPKWLATCTLKIKTFRCCRKCRNSIDNASPVLPIKTEITSKNEKDGDYECHSNANDIQSSDTIDNIEWKDVGQVVDKVFFVVSLSLTNIFSLVFLILLTV